MFRRSVSLLVMVSFVASQLAAMPHAHGAATPEEQREHDAHPHVHVGHGGHSHDHGHKHVKQDGASQGRDQQAPRNPNDDHDTGAIYLPAAGMVSDGGQFTASYGIQAVIAQAGLQSACLATDTAVTTVQWRPPNDCASSRPLFLKLRNIRI